MLFPTLSFAAFFALVLPASWLLLPHRVRWRVFMIAASWFFYGAADWRFVPLLAASTVANELFALLIHRATGPVRKAWTAIAVTANLAALAWFKYAGFLSLTLQSSLHDVGIRAHVPLPEVVLPIGISFFTFQALSYVIDVARRKIAPAPPLDFAVYLSFFPHLIAGPIVRAAEFLPQIKKKMDPRHVDVARAFWLISAGLFKKVVVASYLGTYAADPLFGFPHQHAGIEALFGVYAYAIQIYMDFSGYTDIAIGLALLLGINFPQNFNAPYAAISLQDFWRRWHITLSRWLRDYLYIPLGGNRQGRTRSYVNIMLTMLLGGLWHGAAWTFVAWGALHGIGLCIERWRHEHQEGKGAAPPATSAAEPDQPVAEALTGAWRRALHAHISDVPTSTVGAAPGRGSVPLPAAAPAAVPVPGPGSVLAPAPVLAPALVAQAAPPPGPVPELGPVPGGPRSVPGPVAQAAPPPGPLAGGPRSPTTVSSTPSESPRGPVRRSSWLGWLVTFHLVCLGWVFFRATSFHNAVEVLGRIADLTGRHRPFSWKVAGVVAGSMALQLGPRGLGGRLQAAFSRFPLWGQALVLTGVLTTIDLLGPAGVAPFIYFRF